MRVIIFFLKRQKLTHKLTYSKTMKSDVVVALFASIISLFVGYLALNSIGGSSVDLYDIFIVFWYFNLLIIFIKFFFKF